MPPELQQQVTLREPAMPHGKLESVLKESESHTLLMTLEEQHWNVARCARVLGISRATMYEKMKKYGIKRLANLP